MTWFTMLLYLPDGHEALAVQQAIVETLCSEIGLERAGRRAVGRGQGLLLLARATAREGP
jgi:hypothetical protein